jgi:hypothetical protein
MKNLFVGNMSFQTTADDLRALFEPFGQLARVHVATDRETGRARGFGFVEMPNDAEAAKAIAVRADRVAAAGAAVESVVAAAVIAAAIAAVPVAATPAVAKKKDSRTRIIAKSRVSRANLAGNPHICVFRRMRNRA